MTFVKKPVFIAIIIFLLAACRGREVTLPLAFEGEKLVVWGKLEAGQPAQVQVRKTFPAVGPVPEQTAVTTATVSLYKNGALYTRLVPREEAGIYGSDSLIQAGERYVVKVEAPGLATAESEEVTVPAGLPGFTYTRKRDAEPEKDAATRPHQDLVSLRFTGNLHNSYLIVGFLAYFTAHNWPFYWPATDNIVANEEDCHTRSSFYDRTYGEMFMMNGDCVPADTPLGFFVSTGVWTLFPDSSWGYDRARKITLLLASSTREWFLYNQVENKQPEGLDHLVLPPQKAYTNIKNGYGIIYGYHAAQIELE